MKNSHSLISCQGTTFGTWFHEDAYERSEYAIKEC
jgi:hypothetical protein